MHHKLSVFAVIVALLLGAVMVGGRSVSAAPGNGNGAQTGGGQISVDDCSYDSTICFQAQGEYHWVYTPSDGFNVQANLRSACFTFDDGNPADYFSACAYSDHLQFHTKAGEVQVVHISVGSGTVTYGNETVCFSAAFHEANGNIQYDGIDWSPC